MPISKVTMFLIGLSLFGSVCMAFQPGDPIDRDLLNHANLVMRSLCQDYVGYEADTTGTSFETHLRNWQLYTSTFQDKTQLQYMTQLLKGTLLQCGLVDGKAWQIQALTKAKLLTKKNLEAFATAKAQKSPKDFCSDKFAGIFTGVAYLNAVAKERNQLEASDLIAGECTKYQTLISQSSSEILNALPAGEFKKALISEATFPHEQPIAGGATDANAEISNTPRL